MPPRTLKVATYNIHKGLSPLNRKLIIHDVREQLHDCDADIVFLQEVQGEHAKNETRFDDWPDAAQHEHIAGGKYQDIVYGVNARHRHGHHGNAILSAFPIHSWTNRDVSHHRFESRGHLMTRIEVPGWKEPVTCVCVHLGLFAISRRVQIGKLIEFLRESVPDHGPLIVAGDFNDWLSARSRASQKLNEGLGLVEAFEHIEGKPARTFPAVLPMLTLDRIYVRGLKVNSVNRLHGRKSDARLRSLSDHIGLSVELQPQ
jgi:endonuclease/exonuclease/phosphatase family metal-dependent hydrolase